MLVGAIMSSMRTRQDRGITSVELIILIVVLGLASAVTVPALLRGSRNAVVARCEANLKALGEAVAASPPGAPDKGEAYWERLAASAKLNPEVLVCPLSGRRYRGPSEDPSRLPPNGIVGGDAPGSHGPGEGGHVLLKSGEVRACRERDPLWRAAADSLSP
jgi:hypothetical protein